MDKRKFPGGQTNAEKAECEQEKAIWKAINRAIGPAANRIIFLRSLVPFILTTLISSTLFATLMQADYNLTNANNPISYGDATKRVYSIKNLSDKNFSPYTYLTYMAVGIAIFIASLKMHSEREKARKVVIEVMDGLYEFDERMYFIYNSPWRHVYKYDEMNKMDAVARAILKNIAKQDPDLFNNLISSNTDVTRDYAATVASAHLKSHPEDFKKLLEAYAPESLPKSLVKKYGQKNR